MHDLTTEANVQATSAGRPRDVGAALAVTDWSLEMIASEATTLATAAPFLAPHTRIYVPWLPRQNILQLGAAVAAIELHGCEAVPHLAARCVEHADELEALLSRLVAEHGLRRVLLIGGDSVTPQGAYKDSLALLNSGMLARAGLREVGFAVYPEGHPHVQRTVAQLLQSKVATARSQGLAPHLVSQFSFAPRRVLECAADLARQLPDVPLRIGIAGPTDPLKLLRYARRCGVDASRRALGQLGTGIARLAMHTDPRAQLAVITQHLSNRAHSNIAGAHIFSFGGFEATARWLATLRRETVVSSTVALSGTRAEL